jgi:hypothetical protein
MHYGLDYILRVVEKNTHKSVTRKKESKYLLPEFGLGHENTIDNQSWPFPIHGST